MMIGSLSTIINRARTRFQRCHNVEIHIADHCNLNCCGCSHYAPIADKWFMTAQEFETEISLLAEKLPRFFNVIKLMGGEPLMNPEIGELIRLTRVYFPEVNIYIVTNGILIRKMCDSFFDICRKCRVEIYITIYPINIDYEQLKSFLETKGVKCGFYGDRTECNFRHDVLNRDGRYSSWQNYVTCTRGGTVLQLRHNKIFACAQCAYIEYINKRFNTNFQYQTDDYLDLNKIDSVFQLWKFIFTKKSFCRYCALDKVKKVEWKLSKGTKDEWF